MNSAGSSRIRSIFLARFADLPRSFDLFAPTRTFVSYDSPRDFRYSGFSLSLSLSRVSFPPIRGRHLRHWSRVYLCESFELCSPCSFDRRFDKRESARVELAAFRDSLRISSFLLPLPFSLSLSFLFSTKVKKKRGGTRRVLFSQIRFTGGILREEIGWTLRG